MLGFLRSFYNRWLQVAEYIQIYGMVLYKIGQDSYFLPSPSAMISDNRETKTVRKLAENAGARDFLFFR
jgi:hypothetical protein